MKKPDRFERIVNKVKSKSSLFRDSLIHKQDAIKLLRREHNWMVRMVKAEPELPYSMPDEMWEAMRLNRAVTEEAMRSAVRKTKKNILNALTRRKG